MEAFKELFRGVSRDEKSEAKAIVKHVCRMMGMHNLQLGECEYIFKSWENDLIELQEYRIEDAYRIGKLARQYAEALEELDALDNFAN